MQTPTDVQIIEAARRAIGAGPAAQGKLLEITMSREALLSFARELLRASALSYTGPDKGERPSSATCKAMSLAYDVLEAVRRDYVTGHHGFDRSSGCDYDYEVCNQCDQRDSHEPRCIVKGIEDAICALSAQLHDDPPSSPSNAGERG